jgi:hypothetical protein
MEKYNKKFAEQLKYGKKSERENMEYIEQILNLKLKEADDEYSHFDFFSVDKPHSVMAELKDRRGLKIDKDDNVCLRSGRRIKTLFFDKPKLDYSRGHPELDAYMVWKVENDLFVWKFNHNKTDYYIESDWNHDFGIGVNRTADVVNVYIDKCERYEITS